MDYYDNHSSSNASKIYFLTKLNESSNKDKVIKQLEDELTNKDEYFNMNSKFIFGKKVHFNTRLVKHTTKRTSVKVKNTSPEIDKKRGSLVRNDPIYAIKSQNAQYSIINSDQTKRIYEEIEDSLKNTKKDNKLYQSLPNLIKDQLKNQEEILSKNNKREKLLKSMSNTLCRKSNKKLKELLLYSTDVFNLSKRIKNDKLRINKSTDLHLNDLTGEGLWIANLRTDSNKFKNKKIFNRMGKEPNQLYAIYNPLKTEKEGEIFFRPNPYFKNCLLKEKKKRFFSKDDSKDLTSLNELKVKGINLFNYEAKNELKLRGRKRIYKMDYLEKFRFLQQEDDGKTNANQIINTLIDDKVITQCYDDNSNLKSKIQIE